MDYRRRKTKKIIKIAENFFISSRFMTYLENKLDDDRKEGEWENIVMESGEIKGY